MKVVTPQQQVLFELSEHSDRSYSWSQFSRTFETADVPMECRIVLTNMHVGGPGATSRVGFDSLSLVSP